MMMESHLAEILQNLGQRKKTGLLQVSARHLDDGSVINIFLQGGYIIYCEHRSLLRIAIGLHLIAYALEWTRPEMNWLEDRDAPRIAYRKETQAILFRIAGLHSALIDDPLKLQNELNSESLPYEPYYNNLHDYTLSLHVLDTEFSGLHFYIFDKKNFIGRKEKNADFVISHPTLSSKHAEIRLLDDGLVEFEDLDSTNGSFVNDVRIKTTHINEGDRIMLGDVSMVFCATHRKEIRQRMQKNDYTDVSEVKLPNQSIMQTIRRQATEDTSKTKPVQPNKSNAATEKGISTKILIDEISKKVNFWKKEPVDKNTS
ncbi:MAG: FHA domain-containing protein [Verrucomicrobiota bacterium]